MFGQSAFLFSDFKIATASSGQSDYGHTFGGPHDRADASLEACDGIRLHLLHRLNLEDPAIPVSIPGVRWLPLYYAFDDRVRGVIGYQLTSDDALSAFFPYRDRGDREQWPEDGYSLEFPRSEISVSQFEYDPTDLDDAYLWSGIFGIRKLSEKDQAKARKRVSDQMDGLGFARPETDDEFERDFSSPFMQGKPQGGCLNPNCAFHETEGQLSVVALMSGEPVEGVHVFGKWGDGVTLIFQLCPECHSVQVTNQCT